MSLERKYAWPKIKCALVLVFKKALFRARLGVPLHWAKGYHPVEDRRYPMRCQPIGDRWRANPPKARTHGGDYDIGCGGRGRYIGRRLSMGVEEHQAELGGRERYETGTDSGSGRDGIEI